MVLGKDSSLSAVTAVLVPAVHYSKNNHCFVYGLKM